MAVYHLLRVRQIKIHWQFIIKTFNLWLQQFIKRWIIYHEEFSIVPVRNEQTIIILEQELIT